MNLAPSTLAELRALLSPIDAADEGVRALGPPLEAARSAAARLRTELAAIDQQIAATAVAPIAPIPADGHRVETLIAGADVPKVDKKEVEAHAAKAAQLAPKVRLLAADRQQVGADLAAVEGRIRQLEREVADFGHARIPAERAFVVALGEALSDAYRRDIVEFIDTHIPAMLSVAQKVSGVTGKFPAWHSHIINGLSVHWPDVSYVSAIPFSIGRLCHVWPLYGDTLFSGKPSLPPGMVEELIAEVRVSGEAAGAEVAEGAA
jgi:hypothetical protein